MYKCFKKLALVLLTSLMVIAPIGSFSANINQTMITYAAKSTKKKNSTKKKSSSSTKKSTTGTKKSATTNKSTTKNSTTTQKSVGTNNTYNNSVANSNSSSTNNSNKNTAGVWIPKTGKKYHSNSSCSRMKNPSKVSLEEAKRRGYGPCSKCMY